MPKRDTSWGGRAGWYDGVVEREGSYQKEVILPNLLRLMDIRPGETVLDVACGSGFFSREFHKLGAKVIGTDVAADLLAVAREKSPRSIRYRRAPSHDMPFLGNASVDKIAIVLALQNIEDLNGTFGECRRVLKPSGRMFLVVNHPAFRVPGDSSWERDDDERIQYRRVDRYLSESRVKIFMHPGASPADYTLTFHRPLQSYFKSLFKSRFLVSRLEEWISHRTSKAGPWAAAENRARKEIPLFLFIEAVPAPDGVP
ncbi:MAG: class I SAM-dependent methyltransferase [Firmicutes bacterium]|nr:class I SAM-dependent methyltransferase [Bacillota bacterium]